MDLTKVSRILHAGYLFEAGGVKIAFDPIFESPFSRNCHAFPEVAFDLAGVAGLDLNAVFISHYHDDHCSLESLVHLRKDTPVYIFCMHEELPAMIRQLGFARVETLRIGQTITAGPFTVTVHPALDVAVDSIFQIQAGGLNVLNVVDSWIDDDTLQALSRQKWDLILWPFQTMREIEVLSPKRAGPAVATLPPEWIVQLRALKPRFLVPSSCQFQMEPWSWYNRFFFPVSYERFARETGRELPDAHVVRMDPGASFALSREEFAPAGNLPWVHRLNAEAVDYSVDSGLIPPPTSEIARRFPALNETEFASIADFCVNRLVETMTASSEPYFYKKRNWRLAIFGQDGQAINYDYTIEDATVRTCREPHLVFDWLTEIPAYKLHAALYRGESLTSLYMRINDFESTPEAEKRLATADVLEDPLIRVLFQGDRFAYHKDQFFRLRNEVEVSCTSTKSFA